MISFPNAKINLGLYIVHKRSDGFHDIESIFFPIPLCDVLEILPAKKDVFESSGLPINGDWKDNLIWKAVEALRKDFEIPPINIYLHKVIPMQAGLGGGSADAGFAINMLNELFSLGLDVEQRKRYAAQIGSDIPFFIENKPAYVTGRGEQLELIDNQLPKGWLVVLKPDFGVGTKEAYSGIVPASNELNLKSIVHQPEQWKGQLFNQFESIVFKLHPQLQTIKEMLYAEGACYVSMSGSGSTLVAFFKEKPTLKVPENYWVWSTVIQ